ITCPPVHCVKRGTQHSDRPRSACLGIPLVARGWPYGQEHITLCSASPDAGVAERYPCSCESVQTAVALVGFQGRGCADGVQLDFCHALLPEALIVQES